MVLRCTIQGPLGLMSVICIVKFLLFYYEANFNGMPIISKYNVLNRIFQLCTVSYKFCTLWVL